MRSMIWMGLALVFLSGCVATHERPMNDSEKTLVSQQVAKLVAEEKDGILDTRKVPEIKCERFKRTGSHMVLRHCYTVSEDEEMTAEVQGEMRDRFGKIQCLNRTLGSLCSNASPQDPFAGLAGRNPGGPN